MCSRCSPWACSVVGMAGTLSQGTTGIAGIGCPILHPRPTVAQRSTTVVTAIAPRAVATQDAQDGCWWSEKVYLVCAVLVDRRWRSHLRHACLPFCFFSSLGNRVHQLPDVWCYATRSFGVLPDSEPKLINWITGFVESGDYPSMQEFWFCLGRCGVRFPVLIWTRLCR